MNAKYIYLKSRIYKFTNVHWEKRICWQVKILAKTNPLGSSKENKKLQNIQTTSNKPKINYSIHCHKRGQLEMKSIYFFSNKFKINLYHRRH